MATRSEVDLNQSRHAVRFYADEAELAEVVADHLAPGTEQEGTSVVIATAGHLDLFEARLAQGGLDVLEARRARTLITLDATETLGRFMVDGHPDPAAFDATVGGLIRDVGATGRAPMAYGEMVAVLWVAGNVVGALELEELWNGLLDRQDFSLLCAYPTSSVEGHAEALQAVRRLHPEVLGEPMIPVRQARQTFPALPPSAGAARRFAAEQLEAWGLTSIADDVVLAVSELVTNALVHSGTGFAVTLSSDDGTLRLEVEDGRANGPQPAPSPDLETLTGRGLLIVDALTRRWGTEPLATGKVVWAEFRPRSGGSP